MQKLASTAAKTARTSYRCMEPAYTGTVRVCHVTKRVHLVTVWIYRVKTERIVPMNNKLTLTGANKLFFAFTAVFLIYQFIAAIYLGEALLDNIYVFLLINQALIASFVLIYCRVKKISIRETFKIRKLELLPALLIVLMAVPAILAATMLNNIVAYLLQFIIEVPPTTLPVPKNVQELITGILIVGIAPGVCEELMHRGFLLTAYERRGSYKAVVIVSILFGLFHFDITNLLGPIFLGLLIGYYVVRTGSILAGMLAHFLNNAIAEVIQFLFSDPVQTEQVTLAGEELLGIIAMGIGASIIGSGLLYVFRKVTEEKSVIIPPISSVRQDVRAVLSHWPVAAVLAMYILWTLFYIFSLMAAKFLAM